MSGGRPDEGALGQTITLTSAIRGILADYDGSQILNEMLQNADDAKASEVNFVMDHRQHATDSLIGPTLAPFQGPALLVHNDAVFTDRDLESIQNVGAGLKARDPQSTGQFGLGFNSVYHLTDVASFVTRDKLVMFDPHRKYLPGIEHGPPGKYFCFTSEQQRAAHSDQFTPFRNLFGTGDLSEHYEGTIFRFPLRSPALAKHSELKPGQPCTVADIHTLFEALKQGGSNPLLFLSSVRKLSIWTWLSGAASPTLIHRVEMQPVAGGTIPKLVTQRGRVREHLKKLMQASIAKNAPRPFEDMMLTIAATVENQKAKKDKKAKDTLPVDIIDVQVEIVGPPGSTPVLEQWRLVVGIAKGKPLLQAAHLSKLHTLVPRVGIALRMDPETGKPIPIQGQAFCTLPLPAGVTSGVPVHINGGFSLSRNRRNITSGGDVQARDLVSYNEALKDSGIPQVYMTLLETLVKQVPEVIDPSTFYAVFPDCTVESDFKKISSHVYSRISRTSLPTIWVPAQHKLIPAKSAVLSEFLLDQSDDDLRTATQKQLQAVSAADLETLKIPAPAWSQFTGSLSSHEASIALAGAVVLSLPDLLVGHVPEHVSDPLRDRDFVKAVDLAALVNAIREAAQSWTLSPENGIALLKYLVYRVLVSGSISKDGHAALNVLRGLPLLPSVSGSLELFGGNATMVYDPPGKLPALSSVLFAHLPRQVLHPLAVSHCPFVDLDWFQASFRIHGLTADTLHQVPPSSFFAPELITQTGPVSEWPATGPTREWIDGFWRLVARDNLTTFTAYLSWPVVPIADGKLMQISKIGKRLLAGRETGAVQGAVCDTLVKLGCHVLDESFPVLLPESCGMIKVTGVGVLETLVEVHSASGRALDCLTDDERWDLARFIARDVVDLNESHHTALKSLPLFQRVGLEQQGDITAWVALGDDKWYTLPEDIPHGEMFSSNLNLVASPPTGTEALYACVGIKQLSRIALFRDVILPGLTEMHEKERERHLANLRLHYQEMIVDYPDFQEELVEAKLFRGPDGKFHPVSEFIDPSVPLLAHIKGNWSPPPPYNSRVWLAFLRSLGLVTDIDAQNIIEFAREVDQDNGEDEAREAGLMLAEHLLRKYWTYAGEGESFFEELRTIPFVPAQIHSKPTAYTPKPLVSFNEACGWQDFSLLYSQVPVLDRRLGSIGPTLAKKLNIVEADYNVELIIQHLLFLTQPFQQEPRSRKVPSSLLDELRTIYGALEILSGRRTAYRDAIVNALSSDIGVKWLFVEEPCAEPKKSVITFVGMDTLFFDLPYVVPGLAYPVPRYAQDYHMLLDLFTVLDTPSPAQCVQLIAHIGQAAIPPARLDANSIQAIAAFAQLLDRWYRMDPNKLARLAPEQVTLPDAQGSMRPCPSLVVDDAPWLSQRIDIARVPLLHPSVSKSVALALNARVLSEAVTETLHPSVVDSIVPSQSHAPARARWQANIVSPEFRQGLLRLVHHENRIGATPGHGASSEQDPPSSSDASQYSSKKGRASLYRRLEALSGLTVVCTESLQTQFVLHPEGIDLTTESAGSLSVTDLPRRRIILVPRQSEQILLSSLASEINTFLGQPLRNLQPVCAILDTVGNRPGAISSILNMLRITALADTSLDPSNTLGQPVSDTLAPRLHPEGISTSDGWGEGVRAGERLGMVVSSPDDEAPPSSEGVNNYILVEFKCVLEKGMFLVQIDELGTTQRVNGTHLHRILSVREWMAMRTPVRAVDDRLSGRADREIVPGTEADANGDSDGIPPPDLSALPPRPPVSLGDETQGDSAFDQLLSDDQVVPGSEPAPADTNLVEIGPENPDEYLAKEMAALNQAREHEKPVESEPANIDDIMEISVEDEALMPNVVKAVKGRKGIRPGYDLIRWGLIDEVAVFHTRTEEMPSEREGIFRQAVEILREVCAVFDYQAYYVALFYQKQSVSRFVAQRLMYNIWPLEEYMNRTGVTDLRTDPTMFAHCYFYGLCIHKLAHFHEVVHGTRHDFYMNELRAEFMLEWLALIESKGQDPAEILSGPHGHMLQRVVF